MNRFRVLIAQCASRSENIERKVDRQLFDTVCGPLRNYGSFDAFDCVIPMRISDAQYLNLHLRRMNGHKFFVPANNALEIADDKILFNQFLQSNGFQEYLPNIDQANRFPYVIKRNKDMGGLNTFIVQNEQDEQAHSNLFKDKNYFVQSYIPGDTEYTDHMLFAGGKVIHAFTIKFNMNQELYVRGTRMQPYKNVQMNLIKPIYTDLFSRILEQLNFEGMCCFNYKIVNDKPLIFELNPRIGGSAHMDINGLLMALKESLEPQPVGMWQTLRNFLPF